MNNIETMEFIYADSLKLLFNVFGHFYDLKIGNEIFKCRSVLEVVSNDIDYSTGIIPDAIVIMMNPGSSRPLDNDYQPKCYETNDIYSIKWEKEIVKTRPDNAQYQIMRLMLEQNWRFVRVLNLSDLRNGNSSNFGIDFQAASTIDNTHPHSILNYKRKNEFINHIKTKNIGSVIIAWGAVEVLRELAIEAKTILKKEKAVGVKFDDGSPWYKYPSPYKKIDKIKWLKNITIELEKTKVQTS